LSDEGVNTETKRKD